LQFPSFSWESKPRPPLEKGIPANRLPLYKL
jgi:hypothetical protein